MHLKGHCEACPWGRDEVRDRKGCENESTAHRLHKYNDVQTTATETFVFTRRREPRSYDVCTASGG
jgi:hypothetical protein